MPPFVKVEKFSENKESLIYRTSWEPPLSSKIPHVFLSYWISESEGDTRVSEPRERRLMEKVKDKPPWQAKETAWDQRTETGFFEKRKNQKQSLRKPRHSRNQWEGNEPVSQYVINDFKKLHKYDVKL